MAQHDVTRRPPLRVLVCGGRTYDNWERLSKELYTIAVLDGISVIIHGGAAGADRLADNWAHMCKIPVIEERALWAYFGRQAGPKRNQTMLDEHKPDLVVAFPGGAGTADMVRRAKRAGIQVVEIA